MKETDIIRYLCDEIDQREKEFAKAEKEGISKYCGDYPQRTLITDNCKKIRQLALKIGKRYK